MSLSLRCFAYSQISFLVANTNKKNYKANYSEISKLVSLYGPEASKHLFRCLVSSLDMSSDGRSYGKDGQQLQMLCQEANSLVSKPNFVSLLCYGFEKQENKVLQPSPQLLPQVAKVLKLGRVQEVVFALGLSSSSDSALSYHASQHLKSKLPDLVRSYSDMTSSLEGGLGDVAIEVLHRLLSHLLLSPEDEVGVARESIDAFVQTLRRDFPRERVPVVLSPLIYREQEDITEDSDPKYTGTVVLERLIQQFVKDCFRHKLVPVSVSLASSVFSIELAEIIKDIGYAAAASKQDMIEILKDYGKQNVTIKSVARVLGMMATSLTGLPESVPFMGVTGEAAHASIKGPATWDVKNFVSAVQSLVPNMPWRELILHLDYPGFILPSPEALSLIMTAYNMACREPFPLECVHLAWSNPRGQLSWYLQVLAGCPEFNVSQYMGESIDLEPFKIVLSSEEAKPWQFLCLTRALLHLSEQTHYSEVMTLMATPLKHCPEVLFLAIIECVGHVKLHWNVLQKELICQILPHIISTYPAHCTVLQYAWHGQNVSNQIHCLMVGAMAEWYMQGDLPDPSKMSRILDVTQDTKSMSVILNVSHFPFVIEVACWATKREYLKLDKWVTDKVKEHHEMFIAECVHFLTTRAPKPVSSAVGSGSERTGLTHEIVLTILACLNLFMGNVRPELAETLRGLIALHGPLPPKPLPTTLTMSGHVHPLEMTGLGGLTGPGGMAGGLMTPSFPGGAALGGPPTPSSPVGGKTGLPGSATGLAGLSQIQQHGSLFGNGGGGGVESLLGGLGGAVAGMTVSAAHKHMLQAQPSLRDPSKVLVNDLGSDTNFSKEVDDKANAYFQAIYNRGSNAMSVDRLLELLKQFKDSTNKRERDLFVCMLKNMFEEYQFFPRFPERELQITGKLFGGIIEHGLVTYVSLSLALRYVLESLKKPPSHKMYLFGLAALDKFKGRMREFPQYCASIASIPHFNHSEFPAVLRQYVQYGQQSMEPPASTVAVLMAQSQQDPTGGSVGSALPGLSSLSVHPSLPPLSSITTSTSSPPLPPGHSSPRHLGSPSLAQDTPMSPSTVMPPIGGGGSGARTAAGPGSPLAVKRDPPSINTTNIDTLLVAAEQSVERAEPPDELQDKIHFLFNNLSSSNLPEKMDEFRSLVEEQFYDWVAQYLVMKRASIEPNFHNLYMSFLNSLNSGVLRRSVLSETFRNIKVILKADKTSNNFSDRAILKNLGHWLGLQTLARNKPILQYDLAVKDLILEAYHKGQQELLYVVPFVAKVLESCAESKVFRPPNPWTMAIMSVLSQLHSMQDLKLNLKFEIEVLCKHIAMEISDIKPSKLLDAAERTKLLNQLSSPKEPSPPTTQPSAPLPAYHYEMIHVSSLAGMTPHLQISPQIALFQQFPQLRGCVRPAVEKAVQELLVPVVDRSIKIALTTTEHIIKKDFSLDPDIHRMHLAAHHMVRHLTAGMAMITCREALLVSISNNLKTSFIASVRTPAEELKALIDHAAHQVSADNTELACAFIQKTAVEKAVPEMDKRLAEEFEVRKLARAEGRRYCNATALTYQAERMPEQIRVNVGGPSQQQAAVYEEFARCLPGFLPSTSPSSSSSSTTTTSALSAGKFIPNEEFNQILLKCAGEISQHLRVALAPPNNPHISMMRSLLEITMQLRIAPNYANVVMLLQKSLEGLLEGMNPPPSDPELFVSFRDCHLLILKMIQGGSGLGAEAAQQHVTRILVGAREDIKFSPRAIILLIGLQIVDIKQLDEYLAKSIENGRNLVALSCSIKLVNAIVSAEKRETPITDKELLKTKEALFRLATNLRQLPDSSAQLLEPFKLEHGIGAVGRAMPGSGAMPELERVPGATPSIMAQGVLGTTTELEDPPGLYEKVEYLLSEWVRKFHQPGLLKDGDKVYAVYVARLQQQGILKSDDLITRFFRISVEMCVDLCYRTLNDPAITPTMARAKCYHTMDAFMKLVVVLVRYSGDAINTTNTKINLLNKVLATVAHVLLHDQENKGTDFHQLAYHRFFIMLLSDLSVPDPVFDAISYAILHAFGHVYHIVRPSRAPGFAYSWLELISHRIFIAKLLLQTPQQKGWPLFHQLLIDLFKFLAPFLRNAELTKPTQLLYKGTLRVLLVLLHDFPEFLCDYHYSFCDVIPPNCIQMRNLILSAFPRNMRLPDPFTPNLKVEMLPDIAHAPRILPNYTQNIHANLKKDLDNYIRTRAPVSFLSELRGHLQVSTEPGNQYNITLMNSLVLYVGTQAITYIHSKGSSSSTSTIAHTAHMDIFQHLVVDLDTEGRYLFLNAIANQLRYPNSHTHYFSCALLSLFAETNAEAIQEQITRVLLERLIVNRPHPWGLLITFIELIKNTSYNFWKHEFVHCAPEIEKLFESVAKSCMQKQPQSTSREEPSEPATSMAT